jgi:hypothetical protein
MVRVPTKGEKIIGKGNMAALAGVLGVIEGKRSVALGIPSEKMCIVLISESVRYEQAHAACRLRDFASTVWVPVAPGGSDVRRCQELHPERCHITLSIP